MRRGKRTPNLSDITVQGVSHSSPGNISSGGTPANHVFSPNILAKHHQERQVGIADTTDITINRSF
jgi:hypothetical protein